MTRILAQGRNCQSIRRVTASGLLVDARDYYLAVHDAISHVERFVLIAGWQFDSRVELVRGDDLARAGAPSDFLGLLRYIGATRPDVRVYVLAWDYSVVFSLEREWMQKVKFDWMTGEQIRFVFDGEHPSGASHHQKLLVVDRSIAFLGGIDLCQSRWDDRAHAPESQDRVDCDGSPQKPYHDLVAYCTGGAVLELARLFSERWRRATGETLHLARPSYTCARVPERALPMPASEVGLSLTLGRHAPSRTPQVEQIKRLYEDAIGAAEHLIYMEAQYFTSRAVLAALCTRMKTARPGALQIVIMMPPVGDTFKERVALGGAQHRALSALVTTAHARGQHLRLLTSVSADSAGLAVHTFIHSKLLIVDDCLMTAGSANCTNRSMSFDSELNMVWESSERADPATEGCIARTRADLLCEHAGIAYDPRLAQVTGLVARLDALVGRSKLRALELPDPPAGVFQQPWLELAFDPREPLTKLELDELLAPDRV